MMQGSVRKKLLGFKDNPKKDGRDAIVGGRLSRVD
jgi:hypothetical protein